MMHRTLRLAARAALRLFLPGLLLGAVASHAEVAAAAGFQQGNALYAAGKYTEAAAAYESAVRTGAYSANLFYDLGNTYERLGQRGRSMLNYRRALLLEPAHTEARANLAFVQGRASGQRGAEGSWLSRRFDLSTGSVWPILAAGAAWAGLMCLAWGGGPDRRRLMIAAICAVACALAWRWDDSRETAGRAIVITEHSRALYSPVTASKVMTNLPAGSVVRVLSEQGVWIYAQSPRGTRFWLLAGDVEGIVPRRD